MDDVNTNIADKMCIKMTECANWCLQQHLTHDLNIVVYILIGMMMLCFASLFIDDDKKRYVISGLFVLLLVSVAYMLAKY